MQSDLGKLFIGGISWDTTEEHLKEYFSAYGEVLEAVIMKDRATGRARGFGFIVFGDPTVADRVIKEKHNIDGRMVEAKKAVPRDDQSTMSRSSSSIQGSPGPRRTRKIFVGGLASTVTESDFKKYFEQFGTITDVVVMYDHNTQRPRGFGFITYDSEDAVDKVLLKTFHELNGKMVEVKRAVPKELSPAPTTRSPLGVGYNYGLNRIDNLLNGYSQAYSPNAVGGGYGLRMDSRFSPILGGRTNYAPFGSGYGVGLNFEPGLSPGYGGSTTFNTSLNYGRGPYYPNNNNTSRFGSPIGLDLGNGGNSSFFSSSRNLWGNGGSSNYDINPTVPNSLGGSGSGNGTRNVGMLNNRGVWGSSMQQGGRNVTGQTGNLGSNSFYNLTGRNFGGNDRPFPELYENDFKYADPTWSEHDSSYAYHLPGSNTSTEIPPGSNGITNRQNYRGIGG